MRSTTSVCAVAAVAAGTLVLPALASPAGPTVDDRFAGLDAFFENNPQFFPNGVGLAIIQEGRLIFRQTYHGFDESLPRGIASSSKLVSGVGIADAIARGDGGLAIDTRIAQHVPSFFLSQGQGGLPDKRFITLPQAFAHLSGFDENDAYPPHHLNWTTTHEVAVDRIAGLDMAGGPGGQLIYGGMGMHAAALATANALDTDFTSFMRTRVFNPVNMNATDYDAFTDPLQAPTDNPAASGSVRTTFSDYINFMTMLNQGGTFAGQQVIAPDTLALVLRDYAGPDTPIIGTPYRCYEEFVPGSSLFRTGFGCFLDPARIGDDGQSAWAVSSGAFGTSAFIDTDRRITGVLFTFNEERWPSAIDPTCAYNPSNRAFIQFVWPLIENAVPVTCDADLSRDGRVGTGDLLELLAAWGQTAGGDTDGDGTTGTADLLILLAAFGQAC
jgi:CubicO group peptidase (beta-lactamase class C family)